MNYVYSRTIRYVRLSRGMQMTLEVAVAISVALLVSYLILHGVI